jgi:TolB protein
LTNNAAVDWDPVWSPDGTRIAFVRGSDIYSDTYGLGDIYVMNADGSDVVQRTFTQDAHNPAWSPDGTKIAFTNSSYNSVFLMSLASGVVSPLPNSDGGDVVEPSPAWSPDGAKIAFDSDRYWTVGAGIFTISSNGSGLTLLTGTVGYNFWKPAWSPDGSRISVTIVAPGLGVLIGFMNPDGTGLTIIRTIGPISVGLPTKTSWSPDGQRIAYTENKIIKWVAADGSAAGTIIANGWDADWKHQ